jgi:pyrroloquinoline quinone biosynthesis protein B
LRERYRSLTGELWTRRQFTVAGASALLGAGVQPWVPGAPPSRYECLVLGSIQDGGLPQAGCWTERCDRARLDPRYVASLAIVEEVSGRAWLVDASPDLIRQMDLIPGDAFRRRASARRPFEGILLTHAHMGHYLGLALLGREALAIEPTPCFCTERMARFLSTNGPWDLMVREGRLDLRVLQPDRPVSLASGLDVTALAVPHREEYSDTVGFVFQGARASLLYLPDINGWDEWDRDIAEVVAGVDVAMVDSSFYSMDELPGRDQSEVPHPLVVDTMRRLGPLTGEHRIVLTHLNNSNPLLDEEGPEREFALAAGFEVARAGQRFDL